MCWLGQRLFAVHVSENVAVLTGISSVSPASGRSSATRNLMNKVDNGVGAFSEFLDDVELLVFVLVVVGRKEGDNIAFEQGAFADDVAWGEHVLDVRVVVCVGSGWVGGVGVMGGDVMFVDGVVSRGGGGV